MTRRNLASQAVEDRHFMTTSERSTWWSLILVPLTTLAYLAVVLPGLSHTPASELAWQMPMIVAIGVAIVGTILATIIGSIVAAVVTRDFDTDSDLRDSEIDRHGNRFAYTVASVGAIPILAMAMLDVDQFWIGNALFLIGAIGATGGAIIKIRAHRGAFRG